MQRQGWKRTLGPPPRQCSTVRPRRPSAAHHFRAKCSGRICSLVKCRCSLGSCWASCSSSCRHCWNASGVLAAKLMSRSNLCGEVGGAHTYMGARLTPLRKPGNVSTNQDDFSNVDQTPDSGGPPNALPRNPQIIAGSVPCRAVDCRLSGHGTNASVMLCADILSAINL